jgi:hypothetical protein
VVSETFTVKRDAKSYNQRQETLDALILVKEMETQSDSEFIAQLVTSRRGQN